MLTVLKVSEIKIRSPELDFSCPYWIVAPQTAHSTRAAKLRQLSQEESTSHPNLQNLIKKLNCPNSPLHMHQEAKSARKRSGLWQVVWSSVLLRCEILASKMRPTSCKLDVGKRPWLVLTACLRLEIWGEKLLVGWLAELSQGPCQELTIWAIQFLCLETFNFLEQAQAQGVQWFQIPVTLCEHAGL